MARMYRNWTFINCVLLLFVLIACKTIEPSLPEFSIQNQDKIEPEVSRLNVDVEVNMSGMFAEAEKSTPLIFDGASLSCEGISYTYAFSREPISFSTSPSQLETKIDGGFSLDLSYCPLCITLWNGKESCTVPKIYASCGVDEKKRGHTMRYLTTLGLSKDYKLISKTALEEFIIKDPCELTFLNYDVTERVQKEIEKELGRHYKSYWQGLDSNTQFVIAKLLRHISNVEMKIELDLDSEKDATRVCFVMPDHPGIFSRLSGAVALAGANVVDARTYTSSDGFATAVFWLQDKNMSPYKEEQFPK